MITIVLNVIEILLVAKFVLVIETPSLVVTVMKDIMTKEIKKIVHNVY